MVEGERSHHCANPAPVAFKTIPNILYQINCVFQIGLDVRTVGEVSSVYIPQTVLLLNSFVALHWITEQLTTPAPSNAM